MKTEAPAIETWRDWTPEDKSKQPRRICSVAGCKGAPARVKETKTERPDGTLTTRKHVYCTQHLPAS